MNADADRGIARAHPRQANEEMAAMVSCPGAAVAVLGTIVGQVVAQVYRAWTCSARRRREVAWLEHMWDSAPTE